MILAILCVALCLSSLELSAATEGEADVMYDRAMTAMQQMNNDSAKSVEAAIHLFAAKKMYAELELWEKVREVQSYIFYCKKKMNVNELESYIGQLGKGKAEEVRETFAVIETETSAGLSTEDSELGFSEAEAYASAHPKEFLKIHMRFLEISERAVESNATLAIQASRKSSDALQAWVQAQKKIVVVVRSPFASSQREINIMGEDVGLMVPEKKSLKKILARINHKYKMELNTPKKRIFGHELLKMAGDSLDQPAYAYGYALRAAQLAADKKIGDISLVMKATAFLDKNFALEDITELRNTIIKKGRSAVGKSALKLFANPTDINHNVMVGLCYCVVGDNWKEGLILLQNGDNEALKKIAAMELSKPKIAGERKQLADEWMELTQDKKLKIYKKYMLARSAKWYALALPELKGVSKDEAFRRLTYAAQVLPIKGLEYYPTLKINKGTFMNDKKWDAFPALTVTVKPGSGHTFTGATLLPGQQLRVQPQVGKRWNVNGHDGTFLGTGWHSTGDTFTLEGESRRLEIGTMLVQVGDGPLIRPTEIITGNGKVYIVVYKGDSGSGSIDCKIIGVPVK